MIEPAAVIAAARSLLGTNYAHQGRIAGRAVDCIGVAVLVGRQLGLCSPGFDILGYGRDPHDGTLLQLLDDALARLPSPEPGALVALPWFEEPQHCGILGEDPRDGTYTLIHADGRVGRCVEHRLTGPWPRRVAAGAIFALPGVSYAAAPPQPAALIHPIQVPRPGFSRAKTSVRSGGE